MRRVPRNIPVPRQPYKVERRAIQAFYGSGPRDVDAHVVGPLAVHRDCDVDVSLGVNWCVTHVRTGGTIIGVRARATFRQAMKIARACAGLDWEFGSLGKLPRWFEQGTERSIKLRAAVRIAGVAAGLTLRSSRIRRIGRSEG